MNLFNYSSEGDDERAEILRSNYHGRLYLKINKDGKSLGQDCIILTNSISINSHLIIAPDGYGLVGGPYY